MNLYEINVKDAKGVNHKSKIYEVHEGEAQKAAFALGATLGAVKLEDCTVTLIQEHAGVSKMTEAEQLTKIENILRGLGPDSYCAAAFDGCVEIAADNIRDDFVNSMKHNFDSASEEASKLAVQLVKAKEDLKRATANANLAAMEASEAKKRLAEAKDAQIPADVLDRLAEIMSEKAKDAESLALHNADCMIAYLSQAGNADAADATARYAGAYQAARREQSTAEALLEALNSAKERCE